jgi:hypothetical protein
LVALHGMSVCFVFVITFWLPADILFQVEGVVVFAELVENGFIDGRTLFFEEGKPLGFELSGGRFVAGAVPVGAVLLFDESVFPKGFKLENFHPSSARTFELLIPKKLTTINKTTILSFMTKLLPEIPAERRPKTARLLPEKRGGVSQNRPNS